MANTILDGIRVIDLTNENGVYCTKLLAQMGAEVIRIEPPQGDSIRFTGPFADEENAVETGLFHISNNAGKKSITLDITKSRGKDILLDLIRTADILVETSRPGTMENMELDYEHLQAIRPELVMCSITPFGQNGPYSGWNSSSDIIPFAMAGPMFEYGNPGREPLQIGLNFLANAVGVYAVSGIVALIYARASTGTGDYLDIAMYDVAGTWRNMAIGTCQIPPYTIPTRTGSQGGFVPFNYYKCRDGFVSISGITQWTQCIQWMKDKGVDPGDFEDPKYLPDAGFNKYRFEKVDEFNQKMLELSIQYSKQEMMDEGQRRGVPVGTSETAATVFDSPHYKARGVFKVVEHPFIGSYKTVKSVVNYSATTMIDDVSAPLLGDHNDEVFQGLGLTEAEIVSLKQNAVI